MDGTYDRGFFHNAVPEVRRDWEKADSYRSAGREERELLNLRYAMELSDREVTALYGLEVKAVNKRYQRLLAKCRALLDEG